MSSIFDPILNGTTKLANRGKIGLEIGSDILELNQARYLELTILATISTRFVKALGSFVTGWDFGRAFVHIGTLPSIADEAFLTFTRVSTGSVYTVSAQRSTVVFASFTLVDIGTFKSITDKALFTLALDRTNSIRAWSIWWAGIIGTEALVLVWRQSFSYGERL